MPGFVALVAALVFLVVAIAMRVVAPRRSLEVIALVAALLAGALAIAHWQQGHDSRWMVGGGLMLAAGALSLTRGRRLAGLIALICGGSGAALLTVATITAR